MIRFFNRADDLLRGGAWATRPADTARALGWFLAFIVIFGLVYGAAMGSYGLRIDQVIVSATKVPLLLLVTFLIALPSFFVINTIMGLRDDFAQALRALVATQAGLTIILTSLAPVTLLWYVSCGAYEAAILFNGLMFAVASVAAQWLLRRYYRPLIQRNPRHRTLMRAWLFVYAFVGIQMGWVLRPFIGQLDKPTTFFRDDAWTNAYEKVAKMIWDVLQRII